MGEKKQIHMNLQVGSNLSSIFEQSKKPSKKEQVEKINKELSKLDKQILSLKYEFNELLLSRAKLLVDIDKKRKNGR